MATLNESPAVSSVCRYCKSATMTEKDWHPVCRVDALERELAAAQTKLRAQEGLTRIAEKERDQLQAKLEGSIEQTDSPPWRCFHCGEFFTDPKEAAIHFGPDREFDEPGCVARMTTSENELRKEIVDSYQECKAARAEAAEAENDRRLLADIQRDLAARFDGATTVWLSADRYSNVCFELKQAQARIKEMTEVGIEIQNERLARYEAAERELPEEPNLCRGTLYQPSTEILEEGADMSKVICPEPGSQMTNSSSTIPTWRERLPDTCTYPEIMHAMQAQIDELVRENESLRAECGLWKIQGYNEGKTKIENETIERCARTCDELHYSPTVLDGLKMEAYRGKCAEAIRALKKEG